MAENLLKKASDLGMGNADQELRVGNILNGGQLGVGWDARYLDSSTPLTFTPTVMVVLQTPTMYDDKPEIGRMMKQLIESHAKSVTGIDFGYTLETEDGPSFHDGQMFAVPTKSKRTAVTPSFTFNELTGNLVWNLFGMWVKDIQHPDTNAAMQYSADVGEATEQAFVMSSYAMSMMAIQFDQTMKPENIIDAAFYTNMFPTDPGGTLGLERQISQTKVIERTVEMTGIVQHNDTIRKLGVDIAGELQLAKARFTMDSKNVEDRSANPTQPRENIKETGLSSEAEAAMASSEEEG